MGKKVKRKLRVEEYVFEIDGEDIFDTKLSYELSELDIFYYKNGKKETKTEPLLGFELKGLNKDKKESWISFYIKTNIDYLNSLEDKKIIDITNLLWQTDAYIKRPNEDDFDFLTFRYPENNENDMYRMITSLLVYKINNNEFIFKLHLPNEVFTYFKISFNKLRKGGK